MKDKRCPRCGVVKSLDEFYSDRGASSGVSGHCKECKRAYSRQYRREHAEENALKSREWRLAHADEVRVKQAEYRKLHREELARKQREYASTHREERREYARAYLAKNKDKIRASRKPATESDRSRQKEWRSLHKEQRRAYDREYYAKNKEKILANNRKATKARRETDPIFRAKCRIRARIRKLLRSRGSSQSAHTVEILGCTYEVLWGYLLFTWKNKYGQEWNGEPYHIDHVIPLALAKTPCQIEMLCHYSNLCMLTPEDNLDKKAKCEWESFDSIPIGELAYTPLQ